MSRRDTELRKKIENYTYGLSSRINQNSNSNIFKGINENNEEKVAIKVIDTKNPINKEHQKKAI